MEEVTSIEETIEQKEFESITSNYENELVNSILNDDSDEFEPETPETKFNFKKESEYFDKESTDYKKTRKQRKQKTDQHLAEIFNY